MDALANAIEYSKTYIKEKIDSKYVYHNLDHTMSVYNASEKLASLASISDEETHILKISALFHDTGFVDGPKDHEERSAKIAEAYLIENGFATEFIQKVKDCILATKMGVETSDRLSQLLKDADLSGLASKHFFDITERLRTERNNIQAGRISKKVWDKTNLVFLKECMYITPEGKELFQAKKQKNLASLEKRIASKVKNKKVKPKDLNQSISTNKSAQTQFKTALRNHIDLSNIADNKANIMISVNALILTVALPFLIDKSMDNINFLLPTIVLSIVCLVSMIFATLATRPIKMSGLTTKDQISQNKSNLFFFGNYHKMSYEEYKDGVEYVLSDSKALDNSIIRDLFFLGRSLGKKFEYLRLCYNVFMFGVSLTVFSMLIVYLL